jgi:dienelactone hydrolase
LTDHPVLIPAAEGAVGGIVSEPEGTAEAALLLLGGHGRPARSGVNSFWARTARRLAAEGVLVLRIDYSREGETLPIGEGKGGLRWKRDLDLRLSAQAAAWLGERVGGAPFLLAGVCAGARLAIELAGHDPQSIAGVFLIVPYVKDLAAIERRLEANGDADVEPDDADAIDPFVVESLRRALAHAPGWALVGERDDPDLRQLQRRLGRTHHELEVEVVPDAALHLLDQPGLQGEVAARLAARIARIYARAHLRAR